MKLLKLVLAHDLTITEVKVYLLISQMTKFGNGLNAKDSYVCKKIAVSRTRLHCAVKRLVATGLITLSETGSLTLSDVPNMEQNVPKTEHNTPPKMFQKRNTNVPKTEHFQEAHYISKKNVINRSIQSSSELPSNKLPSINLEQSITENQLKSLGLRQADVPLIKEALQRYQSSLLLDQQLSPEGFLQIHRSDISGIKLTVDNLAQLHILYLKRGLSAEHLEDGLVKLSDYMQKKPKYGAQFKTHVGVMRGWVLQGMLQDAKNQIELERAETYLIKALTK